MSGERESLGVRPSILLFYGGLIHLRQGESPRNLSTRGLFTTRALLSLRDRTPCRRGCARRTRPRWHRRREGRQAWLYARLTWKAFASFGTKLRACQVAALCDRACAVRASCPPRPRPQTGRGKLRVGLWICVYIYIYTYYVYTYIYIYTHIHTYILN